jgi:hypothetical protein
MISAELNARRSERYFQVPVRETVFPDPATEGLGRQLQRFGREKARLLSDQRNEAVMRIDRGSPPCTSYFDCSTHAPRTPPAYWAYLSFAWERGLFLRRENDDRVSEGFSLSAARSP